MNLKYKTELLIFIGIFLFLAIGMHFKEWTSHPVEHILALPDATAYGLGEFHPIIITAIIYLLFVTLRSVKRLFVKIKRR